MDQILNYICIFMAAVFSFSLNKLSHSKLSFREKNKEIIETNRNKLLLLTCLS